MRYELWISFRYLISKRKEKFISIISLISIMAVAVGVAALIAVMAVMSGAGKDIREKIIGANYHIIIEKEGGISEYDYLIDEVMEVPHVSSATPFINGQALIRQDDNVVGVFLRGIEPQRELHVTNIGKYLQEGRLDLSKDEVLIGKELSWRLNIDLGDKISLVSVATPKPREFTVAGIFNSGFFEYDMNLLFSNIESAQDFYKVKDLVGGIGVRIDNIFKAEDIKRDIQERLGFEYYVRTWSDLNKNFFTALRLEKIAMFIIFALIVLVACFNIASTLIMIVMEKTRDIGILKSIGVTNSGIMRIFVVHGLFIGILGTIFGSVLGFILCHILRTSEFTRLPEIVRSVYYGLDRLPVDVEILDCTIIIAGAILLSLISTLYPAWQASRMEPVEALRYE